MAVRPGWCLTCPGHRILHPCSYLIDKSVKQPTREAPSHIAFRVHKEYAFLFAEIRRSLGLSNSALLRLSIEHFVAAEVSPSLAKALTDASSGIKT